MCLSWSFAVFGSMSTETVSLYEGIGTRMVNLDEHMKEAFTYTTYAAKHRPKSIVACEYCKISWTVGPERVIDKDDELFARTHCPNCGRDPRVYAPTLRNKIMLGMRIIDPIPVTLGIFALAGWYILLFRISWAIGLNAVALYVIFVLINIVVFRVIERNHGDLPKKDGKIDYDLIREVLGEGYQ